LQRAREFIGGLPTEYGWQMEIDLLAVALDESPDYIKGALRPRKL
jgi:hypothetical protein